MPQPIDRSLARPRPLRRSSEPVLRSGPVAGLAVPVDPRWLWHDGWEPVRRRRPGEPAERREQRNP